MHKYVADLRAKGKVKKLNTITAKTPQPQKHKDYLKEMSKETP